MIKCRYISISLFVLIFLVSSCDRSDKKQSLQREDLRKHQGIIVLLSESKNALDLGNFELALTLVDSALKYDNDMAEVFFLKGRIYEKINQNEESIKSYQKALRKNPGYRGANFNMGNIAYKEGRFRSSLIHYKNEIKLGPRADVYFNMAHAYADIYEPDSSQQVLHKAIATDGNYSDAYMLLGQMYKDAGDIDKALEYTQIGFDLNPQDLDNQYGLGLILLQIGKVNEAISYLTSVSDQRPWDHGAHYGMGQALIRLGREEEGKKYIAKSDSLREFQSRIKHIEENIRDNPTDPTHWVTLGSVFFRLGNIASAVESYKIALYNNPSDTRLRQNLAGLNLALRDTSEAILQYEEAVKFDSTLSDAWFNLGIINYRKGNYKLARENLNSALRHNPEDKDARNLISELDDIGEEIESSGLIKVQRALNSGKFRKALEHLESLDKDIRNTVEALFLHVEILTRLNRYQEAYDVLEIISGRDSNIEGVQISLGDVAYKLKKFEAANNHYKKEKDFDSKPGVLFKIGLSFLSLNKPDSAIVVFQKCVNVDSGFGEVYPWLGRLYWHAGDSLNAFSSFKKGYISDPLNIDNLYLLSAFHMQKGNIDDATIYLRELIQNYPWHVGGHYDLGVALSSKGEKEEAKYYLAKADTLGMIERQLNHTQLRANRFPNDSGNWVKIGKLYFQSRRYEKAIEAFNIALSINPDDDFANRAVRELQSMRSERIQ
tara:strand:+ start:3805 stop:5961 length:2157 start_codon:yes stop_codon:yes gene_type:complete